MAKFKAKCKDNHLYVRIKLSNEDAICDAELESFSRIYIRGFLKPKKLKKNTIEYSGPVGISLYQRMQWPITKYEFFFIMEQIVDSYEKLQRFGLLPGRVVWNIQQVYYNETTKELQFLYIPFTAAQNNGTVLSLIESIGYAAIPQQEPNMNYVSRFMFFLSSLPFFDTEKIEKFIAREDRQIVNIIKRHGAGQSGFMTNKYKDYYEHYEKKEDKKGDDDDATGLLEEDEETGLLDDEKTGLLNDSDLTALLINEDETALLNENQANVHYPSLFRVLSQETIFINKPVFRLGKEKSYVDYFVTNNTAVSRSHADIITRGNRYFVIDLNSKNRTFINDQVLPPQQEVEIFDGDRLKLANEEFVFQLSERRNNSKICPNCHAVCDDTAKFCIFCGSPLAVLLDAKT